MAILWRAPQASVIVSAAVSSLSSSAVLYEQQQISQATQDTEITINKSTLGAAGDDNALVVGQSFKPDSPFIEKIVIRCKKNNTPSAGMYIEIYEASSNVPTGAVIATSATVAVADIAGTSAEEEFTFTEENYTRPLKPGHTYVFVVETDASQSDTNYYSVSYKGTASSYTNGQLCRSDDDSSFTTASTDDLYFRIRAGDIASYCKDVTIRGGERDIEAIKLLGYNEVLDQKRSSPRDITFTAVYSTSMSQEFADGIGATVTGNYWRYTSGEKASNDRTTKSVLVKFTDGTNHINIMLNDCYGTMTERSLNADGHMEETFTFKGLASNYYEEDDYA